MKTFSINHASRKPLNEYLDSLPQDGTYKVEVKKNTNKRSLAQNSLYWMWLGVIGEATGYRADEMHKLMKYKFLEPTRYRVMEEDVVEYPSTTKLNTREFTEYLNLIEMWATDFEISLPHPEDIYYTAMGYTR